MTKLPVLAEIGAPVTVDGCRWGLRRGDHEALGLVHERLGGRRVVLVTGTVEAAPALAVGLAGVVAAAGTAAVLVECDIERPRLAVALGLETVPGLHEYLRWEVAPRDVLQTLVPAGATASADAAPLVCICAGRPTDSARTLLGLGSFRHMTAKLRDAYELVVLLGPPLEGAGGALDSVAAEADCSLAALPTRPSRGAAHATHDALSWLKTAPLGAVVVAPTP